MKKLLSKKKGFTLIELLVVVAILAILMLIAVPRFMDSTKGSKIRTFEANVRTLISAANTSYANNGGSSSKVASDIQAQAAALKGKPEASNYAVEGNKIYASLANSAFDTSYAGAAYVITYDPATGTLEQGQGTEATSATSSAPGTAGSIGAKTKNDLPSGATWMGNN